MWPPITVCADTRARADVERRAICATGTRNRRAERGGGRRRCNSRAGARARLLKKCVILSLSVSLGRAAPATPTSIGLPRPPPLSRRLSLAQGPRENADRRSATRKFVAPRVFRSPQSGQRDGRRIGAMRAILSSNFQSDSLGSDPAAAPQLKSLKSRRAFFRFRRGVPVYRTLFSSGL